MPDQDKTGPESCQAARRLASRNSPFVASNFPYFMGAALKRLGAICPESRGAAAFCRLMFVTELVLSACCLMMSQVFAGTSNALSGSLHTEDHVHVMARRVGDALLITLRIDPGYHVNANPASNEYLIPTNITFEGIAPERIAYPPAIPFKPVFAEEPIDVYEGTVVMAATFAAGALDREHDLGFIVTAQACTKEICLQPDDITGHATW